MSYLADAEAEAFVRELVSMSEAMLPAMTDLAARVLWQFYQKLQSEGFSSEQAFDLCLAYSRNLNGTSATASK